MMQRELRERSENVAIRGERRESQRTFGKSAIVLRQAQDEGACFRAWRFLPDLRTRY
jgi:hypothetical protein